MPVVLEQGASGRSFNLLEGVRCVPVFPRDDEAIEIGIVNNMPDTALELTERQFIRLLANTAGLRPRGIPCLPMAALWVAAVMAELRSLKTKKEPYPSFQHVRMNRYSWFVRSDRAERELGYTSKRDIERQAGSLEDAHAKGVEQLRALDQQWPKRSPEIIARAAVVQQELAYLSKWIWQLREALFRLHPGAAEPVD